jgi:hypothetical protein
MTESPNPKDLKNSPRIFRLRYPQCRGKLTPGVHRAMLDVHAPHEAIQTWKAFFFHIATISIGLLMAIGLEQTVETLHHRHQLSSSS